MCIGTNYSSDFNLLPVQSTREPYYWEMQKLPTYPSSQAELLTNYSIRSLSRHPGFPPASFNHKSVHDVYDIVQIYVKIYVSITWSLWLFPELGTR